MDCSWKKKEFVENLSLVFISICGRFIEPKHIHCQSQMSNKWNVIVQKQSFNKHLTKTIFSEKKQHNHIKLPRTVSALNSRFFENIVIPSKLDANRIIKFWKTGFMEIFGFISEKWTNLILERQERQGVLFSSDDNELSNKFDIVKGAKYITYTFWKRIMNETTERQVF